jgi:hypothetical protein
MNSLGISLLVTSVTIQEQVILIPYTIQRDRAAVTPAECAGGSLMQSCLLSALLVLVLAATSAGLRALGADPALTSMTWALAAITPFALLSEFGRRFAFAHLRLAQAPLLDGAVVAIQLGALCWLGRNGWLSSATACLALDGACADGRNVDASVASRYRVPSEPAASDDPPELGIGQVALWRPDRRASARICRHLAACLDCRHCYNGGLRRLHERRVECRHPAPKG